MKTLVLIRHGESQWNKENRFTGWVDVPLSESGLAEAKAAAQLLKREGYVFDVAYTSVLKRAIKTCWTLLEEMDLMWIPVHKTWRLNERMYGSLQGLDKAETVAKHGEAQVKIWRRSYDVPPPAMDANDPASPRNDVRYKGEAVPLTECLKDTGERLMPYWHDHIAKSLAKNDRVLVAAHGNSLRALIKSLEGTSDSDIVELNVPTAVPIVYELDDNLKPLKPFRFLGDQKEIAAKAAAVAAQAKGK